MTHSERHRPRPLDVKAALVLSLGALLAVLILALGYGWIGAGEDVSGEGVRSGPAPANVIEAGGD